MKFVVDPKQIFNLALKSGKLEEAKEAAETLKEKVYFDKLAEKAMMMGELDITEFCYVKSQNIDKLIFSIKSFLLFNFATNNANVECPVSLSTFIFSSLLHV